MGEEGVGGDVEGVDTRRSLLISRICSCDIVWLAVPWVGEDKDISSECWVTLSV